MKKKTDIVIDREGNAVVGAEVYVRKQADNTLVALFSDDGSTSTANPTITDSDGTYSYYTADNVHKLQVHIDGVQEREVTHEQHFDLSGLVDPNSDQLVFWDDSVGKLSYASLGSGIVISGTTVDVATSLSGIAALADPNADRILFWDDSAGAYAFLAPSTGLTISGTNLAIDEATAANYRADTADKVVTTDIVWDAAEPVALSESGGNVAVDMATGINFTLTMAGNYTLSNPTNEKPGQNGFIQITQDGTGSRTLAYGSEWKFAGGTDPTLSTAASAVDVLFYQVLASGSIFANLIKAIA